MKRILQTDPDPKHCFNKMLVGRPSGTCYVELESQADLDAALEKDKKNMGKRYIEVGNIDVLFELLYK